MCVDVCVCMYVYDEGSRDSQKENTRELAAALSPRWHRAVSKDGPRRETHLLTPPGERMEFRVLEGELILALILQRLHLNKDPPGIHLCPHKLRFSL